MIKKNVRHVFLLLAASFLLVGIFSCRHEEENTVAAPVPENDHPPAFAEPAPESPDVTPEQDLFEIPDQEESYSDDILPSEGTTEGAADAEEGENIETNE